MTVEFHIDYSDFSRLSETLSRLGDKAEKSLNKSLEKQTERIVVPKITNLIPDSSWGNSNLAGKVHAKHSEWHKIEMGNLEVKIKSKGGAANKRGSFGYLVFPDEGRGPFNRIEQRFMQRGTDQGKPELINAIQEDLTRVIEEEL